jgi:hypothetical protein
MPLLGVFPKLMLRFHPHLDPSQRERRLLNLSFSLRERVTVRAP